LPANLTIHAMPFSELLDRRDLLEAHYQELATDKERMKLDMHVDGYAQLFRTGGLFCLGVYDHGELVGYSVNFLSPAMHYRQLMVAQNDLLLISKPYRIGRIGLKLMDATEAEAKARGAGMMLWHAKEGTNLDKLLRRKGYRVQDIVYSKGL
jgi:GNAT superfamily N-acetyltransferase